MAGAAHTLAWGCCEGSRVRFTVTMEWLLPLVGVVLGGGLGLLTQRVGARESDTLARREALRRERVAAVSDFAGDAMTYRGAVLASRLHELLPESAASPAQLDGTKRQARADAWHSLYRVQLVEEGDVLSTLAQTIMAAIKRIRASTDPDMADDCADEVRTLIREFMQAAKEEIR